MEITTGKLGGALKIAVYGPEGIGKTTFAARFPDPLFIDTEGGTARMDVRRLPRPDSWKALLDEVAWVREHPDCCGTLVLDTADWAEQLCIAQVCADAKRGGIEDFGYGRGYTYAAEAFAGLLRALEGVRARGVHIVVTAHAALRKFERPDEAGAFDRWSMKTGRQVAPLIREWCDALLFANYRPPAPDAEGTGAKGRRVMYTTHHPCWDAKNRFGLPEELPFDYESLRAVVEAASPIGQPPTGQPSTARPSTGDIPAALAEKMRAAGLCPDEVMAAIVDRGFVPPGTSWRAVAQRGTFLDEWLTHPNVWPHIAAAAEQARKGANRQDP